MPNLPREPVAIDDLRKTFIERPARPTYDELAQEFGVPESTIKRYAADEGWVTMRVTHQEALAQKSDTLSILLRATKIDARVIEAFADVVICGLQKLSRTIQDIDDERAPSTRAQCLNTCSFAAKNLADTSKTAGIIGLPKGLSDLGKEDNGRWNPQFAHQLNVTVQNIVEKAKEAGVAIPVDMHPPSKPQPEKPDALPTS